MSKHYPLWMGMSSIISPGITPGSLENLGRFDLLCKKTMVFGKIWRFRNFWKLPARLNFFAQAPDEVRRRPAVSRDCFTSITLARGAGGAAARRKRLSYQGSFSMTLGMRLVLASKSASLDRSGRCGQNLSCSRSAPNAAAAYRTDAHPAEPVAYRAGKLRFVVQIDWRPVGDSNPCRRRERAVSWASRRTGRGWAAIRLWRD